MSSLFRVLSFAIFAFGFSISALSQDLKGEWLLKVKDRSHKVKATLKIEFTTEKGQSCLAGDWLSVRVLSATTNDKRFFPISEPLSYSVDKDRITIGRNEICDAYLGLRGRLQNGAANGEYYMFGFYGTKGIGYFSLKKQLNAEREKQ